MSGPDFSVPRERPEGSTLFLDGMRGVAALFVALHHGLLWLHPGYQTGVRWHPNDYNRLARIILILLYPFHFGHSAVLFFFVLSGFVVHLRYARKAVDHKFVAFTAAPSFLWRRARRLYPPLLFAVALTALVDHVGSTLGYTIYTHSTPYVLLNQTISVRHDAKSLAGNIAFLMESYVPVFGTDAPLWSLKYEWWFYVVYPLTWMTLRRSAWPATSVFIVAFMLSLLHMPAAFSLPQEIASAMIIWWSGALLAEGYVGRLQFDPATLAPFALLIVLGAALNAFKYNLPDVIWGLGFVGLIALGLNLRMSSWPIRILTSLKPLGDCSYTLYVIHAPLLILVSGYLMSRSSTGELPASVVPALAVPASIVPLAYALHFLLEKPFVGRAARDFTQHPLPSHSTI